MLVNTTKTTLPALKIAIAWNDEEGFLAINKVIQLCKWMRLNFTFEPIEIAGQNYQKNMIYGIDEDNLTRLKSADIFLHTRLDYSFFDKTKQVNIEDYIDIAMENCCKTYFFDDQKVQDETIFFAKNKQYIKNVDDFFDIKNGTEDNNENHKSVKERCDFYTSIGHKYAVFAVNNLDEKKVLNCFIELLKFSGLEENVKLLMQFENQENAISEAIKFLQKNRVKSISFFEKEKIRTLPEIKYVDLSVKKVDKITEKQTQFEGKFLVSELVSAIKEGKIKLAEDLYLYQVFANGIEVYPNANFWDAIVINPVVVCKNSNENEIMEIKFGDFFV